MYSITIALCHVGCLWLFLLMEKCDFESFTEIINVGDGWSGGKVGKKPCLKSIRTAVFIY